MPKSKIKISRIKTELIRVEDLIRFLNEEECGHPTVDYAVQYYHSLRAELAHLIAADRTKSHQLATKALECLMLGMRNVLRMSAIEQPRTPWSWHPRRRGIESAVVDGFEEGAVRLFLLLLLSPCLRQPRWCASQRTRRRTRKRNFAYST
jgi:hypothetical protein